MIERFLSAYSPADTNFWVLVPLLIFLGILVWRRVPGLVGRKLDERSAQIARELEDAKRMREEAEALLTAYRDRQREAEGEADRLIAQARAEADRLRAETKAELEERLTRRTAMAEDRIARAEKQAEAEVRAAAADVAVEAAAALIRERLDDAARTRIFDSSLSELERRLQ